MNRCDCRPAWLLGLLIPAIASANPPLFNRVEYEVDPQVRDVLRLEPAGTTAISAGDRLFVVVAGEVAGAGQVTELDDGKPSARLDWLEWQLPPQGVALVVSHDLADRLKPDLPPFIVTRARADRHEQPKTGGTGDDVASSEPGRPRSVVIGASAEGGRNTVDIAAGDPVALAIGDRIDLFRGARYVGFARVVSVEGTTARAEMESSLSPSVGRPGDLVVRRPSSASDVSARGYVFRLEGDYALVSLGETAGLQPGQRLFARSKDGAECRLLVDRVYPDHCGATIEANGNGAPAGLELWTRVCPGQAPPKLWELKADSWESAGVPWLVVVPAREIGRHTRAGDFAMSVNRTPTIGVVLIVGEATAFVYVPGVWGIREQGSTVND